MCVFAAALSAQGRQTTPTPAAGAAAAANDVSVTVTYTGKGVVDAGHSILLFLFTDPQIGPNSQPIGPPQIVQKSGATATFKNVTAKTVYVVAIYNEKGTYDGKNGPPAAGTPIGTYMKAPSTTPTAVTPGPKTAIRMTFNDAKRWGQ